jgi:hypothetical protein
MERRRGILATTLIALYYIIRQIYCTVQYCTVFYLLRRIRLLAYVLARRCATTGRIGLGLHRTARAALRSIGLGSWRDSTKGLTGASCGPDLVGPGRLTCYAIGTTASADPRGIFLSAHHWPGDGSPGKVIRHSTRRATLPIEGAGPSSGSVAGGLGSGRLLA